jgi:hypothetical protein
MNTFKKTAIALLTASTLAAAMAAPAQAGWKNNFGKGLLIGAGVGIVTGIIANNNRPSTIYVQQQPNCYTETRQYYDSYGNLRAENVTVCQ